MKTQTRIKSTYRIFLSAAVAATATFAGSAATNVNWGGGSGGTEASPLDVYDLSNWSGVSELSDAYNLVFNVGNVPTVLTNSCASAATTKIANAFNLKYGTWTLLGDYKFSFIDANNSGTEPKVATIVKKGDWELTSAAYLGRSGATTIVTNVSGKIVQSGTGWFQIGNGNGGLAVVENLSGDWTIKGALVLGHGAGSRGELYWRGGNLEQDYTSKPFTFGYGDNTSAVVEKHAGDWTTTDNMILAGGNNSTASFRHDGGKLSVDGYFYASSGSNSVATLNWRGGDLTVKGEFYASQGTDSVATIAKDAGDWTITGVFSLGRGVKRASGTAATAFYHNGGKIVAESDMDLTWDGSCDFHMNGGEVSVANDIRFGQWHLAAPEYANVYLNGGVLSAQSFRFHNGSKAVDGVVFDGGTFKAAASGDITTGDGDFKAAANLREKLGFKVGARGGTIDTAGHDITNVVNFTRTTGSGGMRFAGAGTFTQIGSIGYTGKTSVEAGTTVFVDISNATAILSRGLELSGVPVQDAPYTILASTEESDDWSDLDLANVTCPVATTFAAAIGADGKSVVVTRTGALKAGFWTGAKDNNLSDTANWSDGVVPTSGNVEFNLAASATLTVGGTFRADTLTIPSSSAVVTIGAGELRIAGSLTNANRLAIAQGASLAVAGDLVVGDGQGVFLYSNEGTVNVAGNAVCANTTAGTTTKQYESVTADTRPIQAAGLLYNIVKNGRIFWRMESQSTGAGEWVVGENGLKFINPENRYSTRFYAQTSPVTLYSSSDWTLANTGLSNTDNGDLQVYDDSALTIDTTDYNDGTTRRTVTLEGRIRAEGNVTIAGCGTVAIATTGSSASLPSDLQHTCISNATLFVTDTATLKINADKKITGDGTVSLAAGTTLAITTSARTFALSDFVPRLALPPEGKATLQIDGKSLKCDDHVLIASGASAGSAGHLTVTGTALADRTFSIVEEDGSLILRVVPSGFILLFR